MQFDSENDFLYFSQGYSYERPKMSRLQKIVKLIIGQREYCPKCGILRCTQRHYHCAIITFTILLVISFLISVGMIVFMNKSRFETSCQTITDFFNNHNAVFARKMYQNISDVKISKNNSLTPTNMSSASSTGIKNATKDILFSNIIKTQNYTFEKYSFRKQRDIRIKVKRAIDRTYDDYVKRTEQESECYKWYEDFSTNLNKKFNLMKTVTQELLKVKDDMIKNGLNDCLKNIREKNTQFNNGAPIVAHNLDSQDDPLSEEALTKSSVSIQIPPINKSIFTTTETPTNVVEEFRSNDNFNLNTNNSSSGAQMKTVSNNSTIDNETILEPDINPFSNYIGVNEYNKLSKEQKLDSSPNTKNLGNIIDLYNDQNKYTIGSYSNLNLYNDDLAMRQNRYAFNTNSMQPKVVVPQISQQIPPTGPDGSNYKKFIESLSTSQQLTFAYNPMWKPVCYQAPKQSGIVCLPTAPQMNNYRTYNIKFDDDDDVCNSNNGFCEKGRTSGGGGDTPTSIPPTGEMSAPQQPLIIAPTNPPSVHIPTAISSPNPYYFPTVGGNPVLTPLTSPGAMSPYYSNSPMAPLFVQQNPLILQPQQQQYMFPHQYYFPQQQQQQQLYQTNQQQQYQDYPKQINLPQQSHASQSFYFPTQTAALFSPPNPQLSVQHQPFYCTYVPTNSYKFPIVNGVTEVRESEMVDKSELNQNTADNISKSHSKGENADECSFGHIMCANKERCIHESQWCNGYTDCLDASDETSCSCRNRVDVGKLCDGFFDCPKGEDELSCFGCSEGYFSCDDWNDSTNDVTCLPLSKRCDDIIDCRNGKDEVDCNLIIDSDNFNETFQVSFTSGFLHRNWQGKWYPVCSGPYVTDWALSACSAETGDLTREPVVELVPSKYNDLFIIPEGKRHHLFRSICENENVATYVTCPKITCGTRLEKDIRRMGRNLMFGSLENIPIFFVPEQKKPPKTYNNNAYPTLVNQPTLAEEIYNMIFRSNDDVTDDIVKTEFESSTKNYETNSHLHEEVNDPSYKMAEFTGPFKVIMNDEVLDEESENLNTVNENEEVCKNSSQTQKDQDMFNEYHMEYSKESKESYNYFENEAVYDEPNVFGWNTKKNRFNMKNHLLASKDQNYRTEYEPEILFEGEPLLDLKRVTRQYLGIVGGVETPPGAWPWIVALYQNGYFHCGGVILNEDWVLTAAHCVDRYWEKYYEIQAGMLRRFSFSPQEQTRSVSHILLHSMYNKTKMQNDLALLKLSDKLKFNRWVRPICLPAAEPPWGPLPGTICTAVGWGATVEHGPDPDHMHQVEVPILPYCKHAADEEGAELCAGLLQGGRDTCQGDSGGPLLCKALYDSNKWYVAGVVSHGEGCARPDEPGVYTRVALFSEWIKKSVHDADLPPIVPLQQCPGFQCKNGRRCIPASHRCNGLVECLNGEDEVGCKELLPDNFRSQNSFVNIKSISSQIKKTNEHFSQLPDLFLNKTENLKTKGDKSKTTYPAIYNCSSCEVNSKSKTSAELFKDLVRNKLQKEVQLFDKFYRSQDGKQNNTMTSTEEEIIANKTSDPLHGLKYNYDEPILGAENGYNKILEEKLNSNKIISEINEKDGYISELDEIIKSNRFVEDAADLSNTNGEDLIDLVEEEMSSEYRNAMIELSIIKSFNMPKRKKPISYYRNPPDSDFAYSILGASQNATENSDESEIQLIEIDFSNVSLHFDKMIAEFFESLNMTSKNRTYMKEKFDPFHTNTTMYDVFQNNYSYRDDETDISRYGMVDPNSSNIPGEIHIDISDEKNKQQHSNNSNKFVCGSTSLELNDERICDGVEDCTDGSDERNCSCQDILLHKAKDFICDGVVQCADLSDEHNCPSKCNLGEFYCQHSKQCVNESLRCDHEHHCKYGEDEQDCYALTNGRMIIRDGNGRPTFMDNGIVSEYKNGQWFPLCTNVNSFTSIALRVCSSLGYFGFAFFGDVPVMKSALNERNTENEEMYISETNTCLGLKLKCSSLKDDTPWLAAVFVDGDLVTSAVLVSENLLIANVDVLKDIDIKTQRIQVSLGRDILSTFGVRSLYEQNIRVDSVKNIQKLCVLKLQKPVIMSHKVKSLQLPSFQPEENGNCFAIGYNHLGREIRIPLSRGSDNCARDRTCFTTVEVIKKYRGEELPKSGLIMCQIMTLHSWYVTTTFHGSGIFGKAGNKISLKTIVYDEDLQSDLTNMFL
uniref:Peptidase S1 domain-containing protein n=1 Tax=Clastoptera arizonana TaxID=38151 RepID=A0A1B6DXW5_9HEMI